MTRSPTDGNSNQPLSDQLREAGLKWADLNAAAQLLEDTKSAVLSQKMMELGDIAVNKAEMQTKASPFWTGLIAQIVEARRVANIARVEYEYIEKRYGEWQSQEANNRVAARI